jgi:hypothetical protein
VAYSSSTEELKKRIRECNLLDMELYTICRERFREAFDSSFQDGEGALEEFRRKNQQYEKWAVPLYRTRSSTARLAKAVLKGVRS